MEEQSTQGPGGKGGDELECNGGGTEEDEEEGGDGLGGV